MIFFNFFKIIVHFFQNYCSLFMRAIIATGCGNMGTKKRVGFLRLFSLNTVLLIRKEALNNDSERYYVQAYCTPPIRTFQEHLFYLSWLVR